MAVKKATKLSGKEQVDDFINQLDTFRNETTELRAIIKSADKNLGERIKWNAPSFYYQKGDEKIDIVTFGPYRSGKLLLVFHHPLIVNIQSPILEGDYKDRRLIYFNSPESIRDSKQELIKILVELINSLKHSN